MGSTPDLFMKSLTCFVIHCARSAQKVLTGTRVAGIGVILLIASCGANAASTDKQGRSAGSCVFSDVAFDPATNVHAIDAYSNAVAQLLKQKQFAELDCLANAARTGKSRFPGGAWKLRQFYVGLSSPRPGHATEQDWKQHLHLIEQWERKRPDSITAPIALAESYVSYAWDARGDGYADSVSESGWKLLAERIAKAKVILVQAAPAKCPDWYIAMLQVAREDNWDLSKLHVLFQQAIAFEPEYQYYYRIFADHLQPKWSGEEGDPARFAEEQANRLGGDDGDILYFQIADAILCACQESEFGHFSWPRLQKGYAALEKKYGTSMINVNSFALMASKSGDWEAADPAFKRIGEEWNQELWANEAWFKQNRDTAAQATPMQAHARAVHREAEGNMKTSEGQAYRQQLEERLAGYEKGCLNEAAADAHKFEFLVQVGRNGSAENAQTQTRPDQFALCLMRTLYISYTNKETPLPAPPHDGYWVLLEVDPATFAASAK